MSTKKKETFWQKLTKHIPQPVKKVAKKVALGVALLFASNTASANPTSSASPENPDAVKIGININTPSKKASSASLTDSAKIQNLEAEINGFAMQRYIGHKINLLNIRSHEIGGLFESGNNPCAKTSRYVGVCQLNRDNTLPRFIREYCAKSKHFKSLAQFTTARACHSEAFNSTWDKISKGPHAKEFLDLQDKALYKYQYENAFTVLSKTGFFPKINSAEDCETLDNLIYAGGIKSCANQNPLRTPEIYIRTVNDMCVDALAKQGIKGAHIAYKKSDWLCYKNAKRGGMKKYHTLVSQAIQDMNANLALIKKHGISVDLSIENITVQTYKTKTKAFGSMGYRYNENQGEPKLIKDLALLIQKQQDLAMLKGQKEQIQELENQKINVSGFYAVSPQLLQQKIDVSSVELSQLVEKTRENINNQKLTQLKKARSNYLKQGPIARLMAEVKSKLNRDPTLADVRKARKNGQLARAEAKRAQANNEDALIAMAEKLVDSINVSALRPDEITLTATKQTPQFNGNPPIDEDVTQAQAYEKTPEQIKKEKREAKKLEKMYKYNARYRKAVDAARAAAQENNAEDLTSEETTLASTSNSSNGDEISSVNEANIIAMLQKDFMSKNGKKLKGRDAKQARRDWERFKKDIENDPEYYTAVVQAYMHKISQRKA